MTYPRMLLLMLWVTSCHSLAQEGLPNPVPTPLNSTGPIPTLASNIYEDWTDFVLGVNGWDFMGMWGKYDLLKLKEEDRPVPLIPDAKDQSIFMCLTSLTPSVLEKTFPPLRNANFTFTYFVSSPDKKINMTGEVSEAGEGNRSQVLYHYTYPDDLMEHNYTWVVQRFPLPNFTAEGDFKIQLKVGRGEKGHWAVGGMKVRGKVIPPPTTPAPTTIPPPPPVNTTLEPEITTTTPQLSEVNTTAAVNTTEAPENTSLAANTTEAPDNTTFASNTTIAPDNNATTPATNITDVVGNVTTVVPPGPVVTEPSLNTTEEPNSQAHTDDVKQLQGVARAIWDAFYVFLALFCACLVALIILIARSRWCKSSEPPPTVATYNPRTSSYRLDKVYDNPALDTNSV